MTALVVRGGAEHLPLPDASVDLICTSPPYFGLRSYQDGGQHYDGQVGSEATPAEFLDVLVRCTAEWMRVLKPSGSIWVNLGDKYSGYNNGSGKGRSLAGERDEPRMRDLDAGFNPNAYGIPAKSLMGLPWRYAIRCIDELGLILRAEVVWSKPNGLPESVTDRVRRSHEQWFHMTKLPRYYSAVDEIREQGTGRGTATWEQRKAAGERPRLGEQRVTYPNGLAPNPLGKLPGSVWTIPTEPLTLPDVSPLDGRPLPDHFAAFPLEWPRRIIRGWSPAEVCTACGEGRRPVTVGTPMVVRPSARRQIALETGNASRATTSGTMLEPARREITGYACACPDVTAPATPGVVLDPFGGTGTVALMAHALGRIGVSVDYSHDYSRVARYRTTDRRELAKALQVEKPEPVAPGQGDLFGGDAA